MQKLELLCPAGAWDSMVAAVQNGADAVYLGGTTFSARAAAVNFDNQQLKDAIDYCHLRGVKVYVTINTLVKQSEMNSTLEFAKFAYFTGADAFIVQDIGLATAISKIMPDIELHASTQMTVHNVSGIKMLERMGFKSVVLARELSREQINHIVSNTNDIGVEIFAHGALCCSYSGQCLFSSILGGRSGNRGRCAQPCRLPYTLKDNMDKDVKQGYLLSPKDLCLISELGVMSDIGVKAIKIEGRLKRPEYVAVVTKIYRKYIDNPGKVSAQDMQDLLNAFNRSGFSKAYFSGEIGQTMMSYTTPGNTAVENFSPDVAATFAQSANFRKVDIECKCVYRQGEPSCIHIKDIDGNKVECYGAAAQFGAKAVISKQRIEEQISKLGATPFNMTSLHVEVDDCVTIPIKEINALRRTAVEKLCELRTALPLRRLIETDKAISITHSRQTEAINYTVEVSTLEQARVVVEYKPLRIYAPMELTEHIKALGYDGLVVPKLSDIVHDSLKVNSITSPAVMTGIPGLAQSYSNNADIYGSFRLNIYNSYTAEMYREMGFKSLIVSPELNLKEITRLCENTDIETEVMVYGRIPLMLLKNCIIKACGGKCVSGKRIYWLKDRKSEHVAVMCDPISCTNILLNSKPIFMADKMQDIARCGVKTACLIFTVETASECGDIMRQYNNPDMAKQPDKQGSFTRGHFYRGVE